MKTGNIHRDHERAEARSWESCSLRRAGNIQNREDHRAEDNRRTGGVSFVYAEGSLPLVFREGALDYSSRPALQPSRTANFTALLADIRSRSFQARFDDRLTTRAGQVQLLGPLARCAEIYRGCDRAFSEGITKSFMGNRMSRRFYVLMMHHRR